jgi:hypothetical protein
MPSQKDKRDRLDYCHSTTVVVAPRSSHLSGPRAGRARACRASSASRIRHVLIRGPLGLANGPDDLARMRILA